MITRTLAELQKEANSLNIQNIKPTGRGNKHCKQDYIDALANYYMVKQYGALDKIPNHLAYRLSMQSPRLAFQYTSLKPKEQEELFTSKDWIFTEKINGIRMILIYSPKEGLHLYSRNISVKDYLPVDYSSKLLETIPPGKLDFSFVIDTEITSTNPKISTILSDKKGVITQTDLQAVAALLAMEDSSSLEIQRTQKINDEPLFKFNLIDVLYYKDKGELRKKPYMERMQYFDEIVSILKNTGLHIERIKYCMDPATKKQFFEGLLADKKEGVVADRLDKPYNDTVNRKRDNSVKIKRSVGETFQSTGLGDNIDGFVSGFIPASEDKGFKGLVGALLVSVFLQKSDGSEVEHVIASVPNIPLSERKEMTDIDENGNVKLKPEYYDRVVEVNGQAISARERRLTHPRLVRWRTDKTKYECSLTEEFLESQIV